MADERWAEYMEDTPKSWVQGLYELSSTKKQNLGSVRPLDDGREFIYVKNGDTAIPAGHLVGSSEGDLANIANLAVTANAAVGDRSISFTLGNSNLANELNAFADGFIYVSGANAGNYCAYKIKSHAAIAANANGTVYLYDKVRVAITTSSKVSLYKHKCKDVIIANTTLISSLVGVTTSNLTANYYGWIQKKGQTVIEVDGSLVAGNICVLGGVNGCVGPGANGTSEVMYPVGQVMANNANDNGAMVDVNL